MNKYDENVSNAFKTRPKERLNWAGTPNVPAYSIPEFPLRRSNKRRDRALGRKLLYQHTNQLTCWDFSF